MVAYVHNTGGIVNFDSLVAVGSVNATLDTNVAEAKFFNGEILVVKLG